MIDFYVSGVAQGRVRHHCDCDYCTARWEEETVRLTHYHVEADNEEDAIAKALFEATEKYCEYAWEEHRWYWSTERPIRVYTQIEDIWMLQHGYRKLPGLIVPMEIPH